MKGAWFQDNLRENLGESTVAIEDRDLQGDVPAAISGQVLECHIGSVSRVLTESTDIGRSRRNRTDRNYRFRKASVFQMVPAVLLDFGYFLPDAPDVIPIAPPPEWST